jgi:translation initiation factor eIF-2B subunit alpha
MNFVKDGAVVLVHSFSRAVVATLSLAAKQGRAFSVLATESLGSGREVAAAMNAVGVPVTLIRDAAVGSMMPKVDLVMVGAEGVLESGGIVNKVGTYTVSLCAKALNKPLYVITESFKFTRQFPLSQADVQGEAVSDARHFEGQGFKELADKGVLFRSPLVDYTPPSNITLLCTDLGVFTPSAVSDELIKLYFS